LKTAEGQHPKL